MPGLAIVHALFLVSGATALVYQVAWTRSLSLVFGASFEAISIVLAAFMGGLAAGGFALGRLGERLGRPLRLYGLLELGIAAFALALPRLLGAVDAAYLSWVMRADAASGADWTLNALRVALAFGVLLLPTFCMGGTLPVLVRLFVHRHGELGDRLAGLYAINTLGAVAGTLLAGFVLLPGFGVARTVWLAVAANALIGVVAIVADRSLAASPRAGRETAPAAANAAVAGAATSPWPDRLAFWGTAVAGFASLCLEVAWSRAIAIATGANTYSFAIMLATFLTGIALGSALHGRLRRRAAPPSAQLGAVLVAVGIASLLVSRAIPLLPALALWLGGGAQVGIRAGTTFALCFAVMLLPCIGMGLAFPLAGEARARLDRRFGRSVGDLVGLNTAGAIAGSLLTGFVFIPWLGMQRSMLLASAAYLGWGGLVLAVSAAVQRPAWRTPARAAAVAALPAAFLLLFALPRWDDRTFAAFRNNDTAAFLDAAGRVDLARGFEGVELLYAREGRGSSVSVIRSGGTRSLLINGKVVASDAVSDMQHEYLLGHLPTLLHPRPRTALVVGLGAGLTLGGVAAEPSLERIVVVEIEPAVRGAAMQFADLHDAVLSDPRVEIAWQDGRNHLQTTRERFDVVTADPIHPWAQGAAYLYTTEYYAMIAERLAPGGIACQWLPLYELSVDDLRSVIASFTAAFPHATLWQATGDALLIGSNAPIGVDVDALARRIAQPRVARQLARAGLDDAASFLAEFVMDRPAMERFAEGAVPNTDDNLRLEFSSPRSIGIDPSRNLPVVEAHRVGAGAIVRGAGAGFGSREELLERLDAVAAAKARTLELAPRWHREIGAPSVPGLRALAEGYAEALALGPYRHAALLRAHSLAIAGLLELEAGRRRAALAAFQEALAADPGNTFANLHVGVQRSREGRHAVALEHFRRAIRRTPASVDGQTAAGEALMALDRFDEALPHLRTAARIRPDLARIPRLECQCLRALGDEEGASAACDRARALAPPDAAG